jgi:plasmid stabilization system protein ParE
LKYEVIVSRRALRDLESAYRWLVKETPQHAAAWHNGLIDAMISLEENPHRCAVRRKTPRGVETRQLLYGDRQHAYKIIFAVAGNQVHVAHIRHASRSD